MLALIHLVAASFLFDFAHAFHIPEHSRITVRAVKDLEICGLLPTSWNQVWTEAIVRADENEDYNLFRKWSKYSHYFNPNHTVRQLRADSSLSVMESVQEIQKNSADSLLVSELIGRIIHHVQDSSVPSHVVPVAHASADGFEVFEIDQVYREPISASDCISLSAQEPMEVLRSNALSTLSALQEQVVKAVDRLQEDVELAERLQKRMLPRRFTEMLIECALPTLGAISKIIFI